MIDCDIEEFNWVPETEISESDSDSDMPSHYFDFCHGVNVISTKDEDWNDIGCEIATDADCFEIYVNSFIQPIIDEEEQHMELFKVDEVMEDVINDIPEEKEEDPPRNSSSTTSWQLATTRRKRTS